MRETDFAQVVEQMVAEELAQALAPYKRLLARLDEARAKVKLRKGPGRPPREEMERLEAILLGGGAARARSASPAPARGEPARSFKPGDMVEYRQGRGTFKAFVVRTDPSGDVVIERVSDGKRVTRPPHKLGAARD